MSETLKTKSNKFDIAEYIKKFSKEELIAIILNEWTFMNKSKNQIDSAIWRYRSSVIREKMRVHLANDNSPQLGKEIDALARKFNESKNIQEKQKLLEQREGLFKQIQKIQKEYEKLRKEESEVDKLYRISNER